MRNESQLNIQVLDQKVCLKLQFEDSFDGSEVNLMLHDHWVQIFRQKHPRES